MSVLKLSTIAAALVLLVFAPGAAGQQPRTGGAGTLPNAAAPAQGRSPGGSRVFDVRAYGATGDGHTTDSPAINRAIEAAAAAGGGVVYLPPGRYASYSIRLKSHIVLYLEAGATLLARDTLLGREYDPPEPNAWDRYQDFGHSHWHNSLIWGEGLEDVTIAGPGVIDGYGLSHGRGAPTPPGAGGAPTQPTDPGPGVANKAIALKESRNVVIRDVSIVRGGHFAILLTGVDNVTLDNLKIDTNRDGIDVDASRHVRISNTSVNSPWDDAIVLKASYALGAPRPTEDVTITNCLVAGGWKVGAMLDGTFRPMGPEDGPGRGRIPATGRIKLGTESNGDFRQITIANVVFDHSRGLALESVDGAHLQGITATGLTMRDVVDGPIFIRLGRRMRAPEGMQIGAIRHVIISDVVVEGGAPRSASLITGIPGHSVEDVQINHVRIVAPGGAPADQAAVQVPENETEYPELGRFGPLPAYAFFIRHADGIELNDVAVSTAQPDPRPAFVLDSVRDADFHHVKATVAPGARMFSLRNVEDFEVTESRPVREVRVRRLESGGY